MTWLWLSSRVLLCPTAAIRRTSRTAGTDNPVVDLYIYDVASKKTVRVDVRSGNAFEDNVVGYYVYSIAWTPDSKELLDAIANALAE